MAQLPEHLRGAPLGEKAVSREVLASHQRERVLAEATAVFAKRGYQGTTVDDLLAAGKVGFGNFYSLFEGKEDCFLAAFERVLAEGRGRIAAATAGTEEWAERTYLGLRALIEAMLEAPLEARLVLIEAQSAGTEALARYNGLLDEAIAWLRQGRRQFPAARDLPVGFEQASISGLAFYLQQCLLDSRRHKAAALCDEAAELVLEPIVGPARLASLRRATTATA